MTNNVEKIDYYYDFWGRQMCGGGKVEHERPRKEARLRMWIFDWTKDASWLKETDGKEHLIYIFCGGCIYYDTRAVNSLIWTVHINSDYLYSCTGKQSQPSSNHQAHQSSKPSDICMYYHGYVIAPVSVYCVISTSMSTLISVTSPGPGVKPVPLNWGVSNGFNPWARWCDHEDFSLR